MENFYITFGQSHAHRVNNHTFDRDCVGVIKADSYARAREIAFENFGPKWSFMYSTEEWKEDEHLSFFFRGYLPVNYQDEKE